MPHRPSAAPTFADPHDLSPHPLLKHIPPPERDAPEVCACADTIRERDGLTLPLVVDETNRILTDESRLRWMAACRMQLPQVEVIVRPSQLAAVIILECLQHRPHFTKSAKAYVAIPLLKPAFEAARAWRVENLKKGPVSPSVYSVDYGATWQDFSTRLGFSRALLGFAKEVHDAFEADRKPYPFTIEGGPEDGQVQMMTLRDYFEPRIFREMTGGEHEQHRPMGLGAVLAGIAGIRSTKDKKKHHPEQLDLFRDGLRTFILRGIKIGDDLAAAREIIGKTLAAVGHDDLDPLIALAQEITSQAKQRRREHAKG